MKENNGRRGGRREGAGRPKGDSMLFSFRCPGNLASRLAKMENRTEFINRCIGTELDRICPAPDFEEALSAADAAPVRLPFFDISVTAGFPVPLDNDERAQDIDLLRMLCPHPESSYLIRVMGDSMIDAGVMSGDIVIVDKSNRHPSPREIAVCEINGEYTLKHVDSIGGQGWLIPANPNYQRRRILESDDFSIWGTVTYIIHKARE